MDIAGIGKSYLIRTIRKWLNIIVGNEAKMPVQVIASTEVVAFNINEMTIHSMLSIPILNNNKNFKLDSSQLKQLQEWLQNVIYLIIDKKSMVRHRMLVLIDMRLRKAFFENNNEAFDEWSIILFRDFGQLSPILDLSMYASNALHDTRSNDGIVAYK